MAKMLKCPQCGGARFKDLDENIYKCRYCGTRFLKEEKAAVPPPPPVMPYENRTNESSSGPQYVRVGNRSRGVTILLALFLGGLGVHQFYLGHTGKGFLYLIFCWTYIPLFISLIEVLYFLLMGSQTFDYKYNMRIIY